MGNKGVICGCDATQEWLLEWWWSRYSEFNTFPVTFFDFGMSAQARAWCAQKGDVISLTKQLAVMPFKGDAEKAEYWEKLYGKDLWQHREVWFYKPLAMNQSPYKRTLWLDLDCEVMGSLEELFALPLGSAKMALARGFVCDPLPLFDEKFHYNSGVILFEHNSLIKKWMEQALHNNGRHLGDDALLSELIVQERIPVVELSHDYNWMPGEGFNLHAVILHWVGKAGKQYIKEHGGFRSLYAEFRTICQAMDAARINV